MSTRYKPSDMCHRAENVSPYLRRPLGTYAQFLHEQSGRTRKAGQPGAAEGKSARNHPRKDADDVARAS